MNYQISPAKPQDHAQIYQLKKANLYTYIDSIWGWDEAEQIKMFLDEFDLDHFKTIQVEGAFAGYLEIIEYLDRLEIAEIQLKEAYQGQGLGTQLMEAIFKLAQQLEKNVSLGCFKENTRALAFYERLGFKLVDRTEHHFILHKTIESSDQTS